MLSGSLAAVDFATLRAVTAAATAIGGENPVALNWVTRLLIENDGLKMGVPTVLALYVWLHPASGYRARPALAVRGAFGVILALATGRAAQEMLPMLPRPRVVLADFPFPPLGHLPDLADWSAMPSDTAALAFALTAVVWAGSRRLGLVAAVWSILMVCLPRLYVGYHGLSDLAAGAALGTASVLFLLHVPFPAGIAGRASALVGHLDARAPVLAMLAFFALGAECLHAFRITRQTVRSASDLVTVVANESGNARGPMKSLTMGNTADAATPKPGEP